MQVYNLYLLLLYSLSSNMYNNTW